MSSKKIIVVVGTRPEAIKLAPLILDLHAEERHTVLVCFTGQHKEMVENIFTFFGIQVTVDFSLMNKVSGLVDMASQLLRQLDVYLDAEKPDLVVSQGDTTSAFVAGLASYYKQIPFGHVEAGLRTRNRFSPWPEEGNRAMLSQIADFHFAPTDESRQNLIADGVLEENIFVTGNTVIDALLRTAKINNENCASSNSSKKTILVTGHRRENLGSGFDNVFSAVRELSQLYQDIDFVIPMHPNVVVREQIFSILGKPGKHNNINLIEPLDYPDFVRAMQNSLLIITDSGGVQEEAPALGKPVLVTRDTTERPEGVTAGVVRLVGTDQTKIVQCCIELIEDEKVYQKMAQAINPYGDGKASARIIKVINEIV